MRFKLDENIPFSLKRIIESSGQHQVDSVFHEGLVGTDDRELVKHCFIEKRVLITLDNDFTYFNITHRQKIFGILLLKPVSQGKKSVNRLIETFINNYDLEETVNRITIVETNGVRVREIT